MPEGELSLSYALKKIKAKVGFGQNITKNLKLIKNCKKKVIKIENRLALLKKQ